MKKLPLLNLGISLFTASLFLGTQAQSLLASEDTRAAVKTEYEDELSDRPLRALAELKEGHRRSKAIAMGNATPRPEARMPASTLKPPVKAIVVACNNSKIRPEVLFDIPPGEILTVRGSGDGFVRDTLGNLVEAVQQYSPPLVLVLGDDAVLGREPCSFSKERAETATRDYPVQSEVLQARLASKRLKIVSALVHLGTGTVEFFDRH